MDQWSRVFKEKEEKKRNTVLVHLTIKHGKYRIDGAGVIICEEKEWIEDCGIIEIEMPIPPKEKSCVTF